MFANLKDAGNLDAQIASLNSEKFYSQFYSEKYSASSFNIFTGMSASCTLLCSYLVFWFPSERYFYHLQTCLSLETLTSILKTGLPILLELTDLVNSVIIFLFHMTLLRWLTFLLGFQTVLFWISFFLLTPVFVLQWFFLHWEIVIMLLFQFPLTFYHIHNRITRFISLLITILVLIGTIFGIIWEMFHGRIS